MNNLPEVFQRALAPFAPPSPLRPYTVSIKDGAKVVKQFEAMGRDSLDVALQHESLCGEGEYVRVAPLHAITRESSGTGPSDYTQVVCSCGFVGPRRHEYDGLKSYKLLADERDHRSRPDLARAMDERDMGGRR